MTQGYIILALGPRRYYEMALNAALSIKWADPGRSVALIHDEGRPMDEYAPYFDHLVPMPAEDGYGGVANKLRLDRFSPFAQSMYIDGDCLIVKKDMDRHWEKFSRAPFSMAAARRTEGTWYGFDIQLMCTALGVPYICEGNSGVLYFDNTDAATEVFETANRFFHTAPALKALIHQGRPDQRPDEPFFGAAMGHHRIEPVSYSAEEGSIMVTSWGAKRYEADLETGAVRVEKPKSMTRLARLLPLATVRHSPSILHFIGLKPKREYARLCATLRARFDVPPFEIS